MTIMTFEVVVHILYNYNWLVIIITLCTVGELL